MSINFLQVLFQIVNFVILLVLMKKFLYRPVLKILEQRAKKIHDGLEAAEKSIQEREKLETAHKKAMLDAEKSANDILEGARLRAKKLEKELAEKAQLENEKRIKRADRLAKTRVRQMENELQRKFTQAVLDSSQTLLKNSLTTKDHREIINNQINKLKGVRFTS